MTALPENMSLAIDELETAIAEMESRLESARAERDESKARQLELEIENANLRRELGVARERQSASAEVLRTIADLSGDADQLLHLIAETTARLFDAPSVTIRLAEGHKSINFGASSHRIRDAIPAEQRRLDGDNLPGTVYRENRQIHIPDLDNIDPAMAHWPVMAARAGGTRTVAGTPLRREGKPIGALLVYRDGLAPFTDEELALQQSFADQAVIAIENARLFNETQEALERQTATADVLKVIASSPSDVQPVFDAIATSAKHLIGGFSAAVFRFVADVGYLAAFTPIDPAADEAWKASFPRRLSDFPPFEWVRDGEPEQVADAETVPAVRDLARLRGGFRSVLVTPLMSNGAPIGLVSVTRKEPGGFAAHHVQLLQTFADQAVIAIENTRLFNETQEALERQTATADVLKVIASSPSDVQPVFAAIASSAKRLLDGFTATVLHFRGDQLHLVAFTPTSPEADEGLQASFPQPVAEFPVFALVRDGATIQFPDTEADNVPAMNRDLGRLRGFRSVLFVPLMNQGNAVGIISITRTEPGAFADHHVQLLQTFADQAVIAIENTRLFNETQEALERQTATADILKVIASSPSDVQPVFEAIASSANRLIGGFSTGVYRIVDDMIHIAAFTPTTPEADAALQAIFPLPRSEISPLALLENGQSAQIADSEASDPQTERIARARGWRSILFTPLTNNGVAIGFISVTRREIGIFADHHVQLLRTFADQAVIAIENTRLFNETQEALERQTATADILKVIASSPSDTTPVFEAIASSAKRLIGGFSTAVHRLIGEVNHLVAFTPTNPESDEALKAMFPLHRSEVTAVALVENGETAQIADSEAADSQTRELGRARGWRGLTITPLMSQGTLIGYIACTRREPGVLADRHVQLLRTFADQAVIAIENTRLFNETKEALERQTATAEILKVIASSPSDVQPVFDAIAASGHRLLGGFSTSVFSIIDDMLHLSAFTPTNPSADAALRATFPRPVSAESWNHRVLNGETVELPDVETDPMVPENLREMWRKRGFRSLLLVPLVRSGKAIGMINTTRLQPGPFSSHHVQLLQTFADQAVIAIENTRLFNETREALERQTATADILKVIASSPSDVQPVFDAIADRANRLIGGFSAAVFRYVDGQIHLAAFTPTDAEGDAVLQSSFPSPLAEFPPYQLTRDGAPAELPDTELEPAARDIARARGYRSMLFAPLMNDGEAVGIITVTRVAPGPFGEQHTRLLQMFADQAVIAIRNVGLFNEVQARTRDLEEALTYQTGSANILRVIASSPTDVKPVLKAIVESACELCEADDALVTLKDGDDLVFQEQHGSIPVVWQRQTIKRETPSGRAVIEGRSVHVHDLLGPEGDEFPVGREYASRTGVRTILSVPLLRDGKSIGVIVIRRTEVHPFSDKQVDLLQTFADQAVIAIENVRLFNETREALERQTATSDILKVIASSPSDVQPVFDVIVERAVQLCGARIGRVYRYDGELIHLVGGHGLSVPGREGAQRPFPRPASDDTIVGRVMLSRKPNILADLDEDDSVPPLSRQMIKAIGARSQVTMPMLLAGQPIGAITLSWAEPRGYTDQQIALLRTFADQAVIAIENARLFNEVQHRTEELSEALQQQTATADVLKVISRSAFDLETVLDALLSSACRLCEADVGTIRYREDGEFRLAATFGSKPEWIEQFSKYSTKPDRGSVFGRTIVDGHTVHIPDVLADPDFKRPEAQKLIGMRAALGVPLTREGQAFGVISLFRFEASSFEDRQIELVQTFADQAVIAIENVRLFEEVQTKTRDISEALTYQTGSANILKVIASSPTDIKPVLNAIVESVCELCGAYDAVLRLKEGDELRLAAHHGTVPADWNLVQINPRWTAGRAALEQRPVHVHDISSSEGDEFPDAQARAREQGHRTILSVPLLQEANSIGTLTLRRLEVNPFSDKQIALLQTFADQAVIAIGNVRLFEEVQAKTRDLSESLQFQTASSEVLKVISSSPDALQPVLNAIAQTSQELCGSDASTIFLFRDGKFHFTAMSGVAPKHVENLRDNPASIDEPLFGRLVREKRTLHFANVMDDPDLSRSPRMVMGGPRSLLAAPLLRDGEAVGAIVLRRSNLKPFTPRQVQAIEVFADQAVIAISNVELFEQVQARTRELSESLEQQTATSEVLSVISRSAGDLAPVFDTMLRKAMELCGGNFGTLNIYDGNRFQTAATYGLPPAYDEYRRKQPPQDYGSGTAPAVLLEGEPHVEAYGLIDSESYRRGDPNRRALVDIGGARCLLAVPLLKDERVVGSVMIFRQEDRPFSEKQITLLKQFAAQAVIAIENARLLNELRQRTDDLSESLQQQTATSEVLQVISASPGELAPVFDRMLVNATRVCGAEFGSMLLTEDGLMQPVAQYNLPAEFAAARGGRSFAPHPKSPLAESIRTKQVVHVADLRTTEGYLERSPATVDLVELGGARTIVTVPMIRDDEVIGVITIYRNEIRLFGEKQIELLSNFAKQAVIAIENARLLRELRQRTTDLTESLQQQTATADVLKVISASPGELEPVFQAMLENAVRLCEAKFAMLFLYEDNQFRAVGKWNIPPAYGEFLEKNTILADPKVPLGRVVMTKQPVQVEDVLLDQSYIERFPGMVGVAEGGGARTLLQVPMLKENELVGTIGIYRQEVRRFTDKQIALVQNFGAQAVIAIENARLLNELRRRTDDLSESLQQQTATSEVLQVISSSPGELAPVFEKMLENATRVCGAKFGSMLLAENGSMRPAAHYNVPAEFAAARGVNVVTPHPKSALAKAISTKQVVHVADMRTTEAYLERSPASVQFVELGGARTVAIVPMLRDDEVIGAITVYRNEVQLFSDKQIELLSNFAKQAVIAIENARLLKELRQRTDDLSKSLDDLRTAQDRLVQTEKLASLGQLTAGIAHEIKNPLNFVNNFAALSAELTVELNEVLKPAGIGDKMRAEVNELTGLLKDNLEKVVQHGKRADSIVKNMLLHSREGGGEHRPSDINALIDESLNLAYHGARAERPDFNVTLERDFDPAAGQVDLFPQEITRVFLNLVSNGFYAVTKRRKEAGEPGFEPTLRASTKNLGESVEIRIRDNGTGIPSEVKEKMFNPFFTTKPAGEGTGLGLSMSHDIIVKQHGGTIDVDTSPGDFTEFRIVLPRTSNFADKSRG